MQKAARYHCAASFQANSCSSVSRQPMKLCCLKPSQQALRRRCELARDREKLQLRDGKVGHEIAVKRPKVPLNGFAVEVTNKGTLVHALVFGHQVNFLPPRITAIIQSSDDSGAFCVPDDDVRESVEEAQAGGFLLRHPQA